MRRHISQREAHRLAKELRASEEKFGQLRGHLSGAYSGIHLGTWSFAKDRSLGRLEGAKRVGKILVARINENGDIAIYAC